MKLKKDRHDFGHIFGSATWTRPMGDTTIKKRAWNITSMVVR